MVFYIIAWLHQKGVYSLRCNTPSEEAVNIFQDFDSLQRTSFENILGTVWSNESWHQPCLPISKTGIGIRRASDQIKAAYIGSISHSVKLVKLITGQSPTADHTFTQMIDEMNGLSISQLTQSKIQDVLDEVALNKLFKNQRSERESSFVTLSASIRRTVIGSSQTGSRPPPLAKRVSCSCEVQTGRSPIYEK